MKVLVLGGAGVMGSGAAEILVRWDDVERVTLSDINEEAVKKIAERINSPKIDTRLVDALNKETLIPIVQEYDVVLNTVGPYVKFGVPILESIIEAGVPYVDVCDDHDATEEMLKLDAKAKEHGVPAIICLGTTPGTTNMQAKLAHELLDDVDVLKICWAVGLPPLEKVKGTPLEFIAKSSGRELLSPAAWNHMIHVSTGDVPIWKNGQWDTMPALEYGEYVDFSEPLGRVESYYLGHAEPVTLPRNLKINDFSACLGALMPAVTEQLREEARGHRKAKHPPVDPGTPRWRGPDFWEERGVWAAQAAIAEGTLNGAPKRVTVRFQMSHLDMSAYNYAGQAIGTYLLGKGEINKPGVMAPEAAFETKEYFKVLTEIFNMMAGENLTPEELILVEIEDI